MDFRDLFGRRQRQLAASNEERLPFDLDPGREERQNRETTPPENEEIVLHGMYVTEAYLPTHAPALLDGMARMGWDEGEGGSEPLSAWVAQARAQDASSAYAPTGFLVRNAQGPGVREAELPEGVDHVHGFFWAISPGLTLLTLMFALEDDVALSLDRILRRDVQTYATKTATGWLIHGPSNQKEAALVEARREIRMHCGGWLAERLPGAFAGGLLQDDFPAIDVITAKLFQPFGDDARGGLFDYRRLAHLDGGFDIYGADGDDDLRLALPFRPSEPPYVATLAGRADRVFSDERLEGFGGGNSRWGFFNWMQGTGETLAAAWSTLHLLSGYQAQLAETRDRAIGEGDEPEAMVAALRELRTRLLPRSMDAQTLGIELELLSAQEKAFPFSDLGATRARPDHPDQRTLGERWRTQTHYRAQLLARSESRLREFLATDAQTAVAASGLELQSRVSVLTRVSLAIAVLATVLALVGVVNPG